jgi:hypothetical protein
VKMDRSEKVLVHIMYEYMRRTMRKAFWSDQVDPGFLPMYLDIMVSIDTMERKRLQGKLD